MEFDGDTKALTESLEKRIYKLSPAKPQPSIYKVHKHLRDINRKAYEPEIVAIGPYHRGKDNLKMMEEHKLRYLKALVERKPEVRVKDYISAVLEMEPEARDCYAEPIGLGAAKFTEMLVLDGCFVIELMLKDESRKSFSKGGSDDPMFETLWIMTSLKRDLVLFENQIPFFVLCKLFDLIAGPNQRNRLMELVLVFFWDVFPGPKGNGMSSRSYDLLNANRSSKDVKHILDLLHSNWSCWSCVESFTEETNSRTNSSDEGLDDVHDHVIEIESDSTKEQGEFRFIQTATELKDANVEFRVLKKANTSLFDVHFSKLGTLSMAPLRIEDRTECALRNLIAYEQYFPNDRPTSFTDYTTLLDCLINSSKDVEILSKCKIIENLLGDNDVVAGLINRLGDSVSCAHPCLYADTFRLVNRHCRIKRNRAMAKLKRNHFNSPWAYVSFLAAIVLLLLKLCYLHYSCLKLYTSNMSYVAVN